MCQYDVEPQYNDALVRIKGMLRVADKQLRGLKRDAKAERHNYYKSELLDAVGKGEMAVVWRMARKIASPSLAPRNKYFSKGRSCTPSMDEWRNFLALTGGQGGCEAFNVTLTEIQAAEDTPIPPVMTGDYSIGQRWFNELSKRLTKLKLRKGIPPDDVPSDILRLIFCARPGECKSVGRGAVGSKGIVASEELWKLHGRGLRCLHSMWIEHLASMAASSRFPWQYNLYHAWFLEKKNGKQGCPSLRIIFGLLSVAKVMLSVFF
jgi:hypothetical protein